MRAFTRRSGKGCAAILATAVIVTGCGDDEPTGPDPADVVGQWSYVITDAVGGGFTCSVTGITLTFNRIGEIVDGTILAVGDDNLTCVGSGGTQANDFNGEGNLEDVAVNGSNVGFTIPTFHGPWESTGTVNGNSMGGNVVMPLEFSASTIVMNGTWSATRN
jgi:hypothetical protein